MKKAFEEECRPSRYGRVKRGRTKIHR